MSQKDIAGLTLNSLSTRFKKAKEMTFKRVLCFSGLLEASGY